MRTTTPVNSRTLLVGASESERRTAMAQLEYATGNNIIAASLSGRACYEGYQGHGVLTYALLEGLNREEGASEEPVDVYGLASHIAREVPEISLRAFAERQHPTSSIRGDNFPLGLRQPVLVGDGR